MRKRRKRKFKPRTKKTVGTSKFEKEFGKFLKKIGLEIETQFQIGFRFYDFKIKGKNILIEMDGSWWHGDPRVVKKEQLSEIQKKNILNDKYKNHLAEKHGYRLLRFWEYDIQKNKQLIIDTLINEGLLT